MSKAQADPLLSNLGGYDSQSPKDTSVTVDLQGLQIQTKSKLQPQLLRYLRVLMPKSPYRITSTVQTLRFHSHSWMLRVESATAQTTANGVPTTFLS
ncbi:hypothetical protein AHF37_10404 [Paragonimus kellicotti]|nr:hypothetical protein AHF37_10404 [Paragonimus kellicotti]